MATVLDIVTASVRKLGVLRKGEALDADEAVDALNALNRMLDSWSNDPLLIYWKQWENFTLSAQAAHTIVSGGDLDTATPMKISFAYIRRSDGTDYPLKVITDEEYGAIPLKSLSASPSEYLYFDNNQTIKLYPVPEAGDVLYILSEKRISQFAGLSDAVALQPGWELAIIENLSLLLADEYGEQPSRRLEINAAQSKANIRRDVARNRAMPFVPYDSSAEGSILTGGAI